MTQNGAQTNYVPQAPHMGHSWGTEYSPPQDGKYLRKFEKFECPRSAAVSVGGFEPQNREVPRVIHLWSREPCGAGDHSPL